MKPRLDIESRGNLPWLFLYSSLSIPAFYAIGLLTHTQSTFAIGDFWRFWVVHLWVEDFLELFTTMLVALIFVLMGIVSERFATRLIYFDVMLYSIGGVVGTLHHCYFSGGPSVEMALGAFFSAAEVIPLTLLTVEAWSFLQLGTRQQAGGAAAFPHRWAVLFLASVGFWNFLGAGVFGFLINLPVVSYYEIGTLLTSNHGHAAFMGVYGMLALALLVFCTRYLARPEDWSEGLVRFSFWGTNIGLMLMILGHLFPLGVLQLGDVVTNGYWHARTEWFKNYPWLSWARMPGDLVFMAGSAPLVWLTLKVALRTRKTATPTDQSGTPLEATLYTEITSEGERIAGLSHSTGTRTTSGVSLRCYRRSRYGAWRSISGSCCSWRTCSPSGSAERSWNSWPGPTSTAPRDTPTQGSPTTRNLTVTSVPRASCLPCIRSTTGTSSPSTRLPPRRATNAC